MQTKNNLELNKRLKFGTDGWRAVIADDFTFDNLKIVTQATADYLRIVNQGRKSALKVAVGYDSRFLSESFAEVVACVFAGNNIGVVLSDRVTPTPTISFTVKQRKLDLGVVITASHNPPEFNGFKIKNSRGGAADISITKKVESLLGKKKAQFISLDEAIQKGLLLKEDLTKDYVKFLRNYIDLDRLRKKRFRILLDCMYGSGDGFLKQALEATDIYVEMIRCERNPFFEGRGPEPVEQNLEKIKYRMAKENFDLGLVLDGDADRIAAVAKGGEFIHPQKILCLLALHLKEDRKWDGDIVTTIAGTMMLKHIANYLGLKLYETPVGFKYISELMETKNILVGGEEAGGMGFKNYIPERDGSLAGLLLIEMMAYRDKPMHKIIKEVEQKFGRYFYVRKDIKLKPGLRFKDIHSIKPSSLLGKRIVQIKDYDGIKFCCEDDSWLMLRPSGTEPLMRFYAEAKSLNQAKQLLLLGQKLATLK